MCDSSHLLLVGSVGQAYIAIHWAPHESEHLNVCPVWGNFKIPFESGEVRWGIITIFSQVSGPRIPGFPLRKMMFEHKLWVHDVYRQKNSRPLHNVRRMYKLKCLNQVKDNWNRLYNNCTLVSSKWRTTWSLESYLSLWKVIIQLLEIGSIRHKKWVINLYMHTNIILQI